MEKTTNKFYKASSILCFVFLGLITLSLIGLIIGISASNLIRELANSMINEAEIAGEVVLEYSVYVEIITIYVIIMIAVMAISIGMLIAEGVVFSKLSSMTDEEATNNYGKAMTFAILSFFFGGALIGGLALAGVLTTHQTQKTRYLAGKANGKTNATQAKEAQTAEPSQVAQQKTAEPSKFSVENMEKMQTRLLKLEDLKKMGALSEEEYKALRKQIMADVLPEEKVAVEKEPEPEAVEDKKMARIAKLVKLKESGAINEEEFNNLKDKIINE